MLLPLRVFIAAMLGHWWALMSCAAFTILGVYCAAANRGNGWVVGGSAVLAVIFFLVAGYRTWHDEHQKYRSEVARNERPDIRGEAFNFSGFGIHGDGHDRGHWSANCDITFVIDICNHNPIITTLKTIDLDGSKLKPPVTFDLHVGGALSREPGFPVGTELPHGIGKTLNVRVTATVDGMRIQEIPPIAMDELQIHIVDAFEHKHPIRIKPGENITFGQR